MCRPYETYFAIEANASIFANMSEAAVPGPARCSAADPTGLAAGLGSPSLRSTRDLGVVPRADSPDSPPGYF